MESSEQTAISVGEGTSERKSGGEVLREVHMSKFDDLRKEARRRHSLWVGE